MSCDKLKEIIRSDIGDDDPSNERYDDDKLNTFIEGALKRLYTAIGLTITIDGGELSSTPTTSQFNLIVLQTECNIAKREYMKRPARYLNEAR